MKYGILNIILIINILIMKIADVASMKTIDEAAFWACGYNNVSDAIEYLKEIMWRESVSTLHLSQDEYYYLLDFYTFWLVIVYAEGFKNATYDRIASMMRIY